MGQGTCALCSGRLTDHDLSIVYSVYKKEDLLDYNQKYLHSEHAELDAIIFGDEMLDDVNLWLCDKCKTANTWSFSSNRYRAYQLKKEIREDVDLDQIRKLQEIFIIHALEETEHIYLADFIEHNPFRPFKYYLSEDYRYVYIVDIDKNRLDRVYERFLESDL